MQDLPGGQPRLLQKIAEERAVRLVAVRPLGGADEVEGASERGRVKEIVVDVGDQSELVRSREEVEGREYVRIEFHRREAIEKVSDGVFPARAYAELFV